MGGKLIGIGKERFVKARNGSLLIHGFVATQMSTDTGLRSIYGDLEQLLREESPGKADMALAVARSVNFCQK